jgi:hypothetical protein
VYGYFDKSIKNAGNDKIINGKSSIIEKGLRRVHSAAGSFHGLRRKPKLEDTITRLQSAQKNVNRLDENQLLNFKFS